MPFFNCGSRDSANGGKQYSFFNDVTIKSPLRSVVQVLIGHYFSHTDCQDDLCQKL